MKIEDVEAILCALLARAPSETDAVAATDQLQQCLAVLTRETGFKAIAPGEALPLLSYDLVQARASIETALRMTANGDLAAAFEASRTALSNIQGTLRR
jgi:hypothetical protein